MSIKSMHASRMNPQDSASRGLFLLADSFLFGLFGCAQLVTRIDSHRTGGDT